MSLIALAECTVPGAPESVVRKFVDFRNWPYFMPAQFRPMSGPQRALRTGDRLRIRIDAGFARLPTPVDVFSVDEPKEVVWGGGNALLHARHRFRFEADGTQTRILSDEVWTGLLSRVGGPARRIKRQAEVIGQAQLDGFARWLRG